jgi:hypothetical protein
MVITAGGDGHHPASRVAGLRRLRSRSRRTVGAVILAGVLLVGGGVGLALALSGGSSGQTTPTTGAKIPLAPAMPTKLAGFSKDGAPSSSILRVFSGQPNYIADFPWTMNGCSSGTYTTQWRALTAADLVAAGPTDQHASTTLQSSDVTGATAAHSGLITGDSCHEPVFFFAGSSSVDTLVDVAVVTQHWTAAP